MDSLHNCPRFASPRTTVESSQFVWCAGSPITLPPTHVHARLPPPRPLPQTPPVRPSQMRQFVSLLVQRLRMHVGELVMAYALVESVLRNFPTTMRVNSVRPMLLGACFIACKTSRDEDLELSQVPSPPPPPAHPPQPPGRPRQISRLLRVLSRAPGSAMRVCATSSASTSPCFHGSNTRCSSCCIGASLWAPSTRHMPTPYSTLRAAIWVGRSLRRMSSSRAPNLADACFSISGHLDAAAASTPAVPAAIDHARGEGHVEDI
mgnify:CR=1 FL=1